MTKLLALMRIQNLSAVWDTQLQFLGQEDPLEKGMATHSSMLTWKIPWRSLADYSPWGHKELDMTKQLTFPLFIHFQIYFRTD